MSTLRALALGLMLGLLIPSATASAEGGGVPGVIRGLGRTGRLLQLADQADQAERTGAFLLAEEHLLEARRLAQEMNPLYLVAIEESLAEHYAATGQGERALALLGSLRARSQVSVEQLIIEAMVWRNRGQPDRSLELLSRARIDEGHSPTDQAQLLVGRVQALEQLGRSREIVDLIEQFGRPPEVRPVTLAQLELHRCRALIALGLRSEAQRRLLRMLHRGVARGRDPLRPAIHLELFQLYDSQGEHQAADRHLVALAQLEPPSFFFRIYAQLRAQHTALLRRGQHQAALELIEQVAGDLAEEARSTLRPYLDRLRLDTLLGAGRSREVLDLATPYLSGAPIPFAVVVYCRGLQAALETGPDETVERFAVALENALELSPDTEVDSVLAHLLLARARLRGPASDPPEDVLSHLEAGLSIADALRPGALGSAWDRSRLHSYTPELVDLGVDLAMEQGDLERALRILEHGRASALLDGLLNEFEPSASGRNNQAALRQLDIRIAHTSRLLLRHQNASTRAIALAEGEGDQTRLHAQLRSLVEQRRQLLLNQAGGESDFSGLQRLDGPTLRRLPPPGALFIAWHLSHRRAWVIAWNAEQIVGGPLPTSPARLQEQVAHLRALLVPHHPGDPHEIDDTLRTLSDSLLTPVAELLPEATSLTLFPDEALRGLPMALLSTPDGGRLGLELPLVQVPSATLLAQLQRRPSVTATAAPAVAVVVGDPLGDLPAAAEEARRVAHLLGEGTELLIGGQALESRVVEALPGSRLALIAAHGVFWPDTGVESFLALRPGGQADGRLTVREIGALDLDADLVVLSGCSTGRGAAPLSGESDTRLREKVGLSLAFLIAGARRVVGSLWEVADEPAALLSEELFARLEEGLPASEALLEARRSVAQRYPHPAFWAPFFLEGLGPSLPTTGPVATRTESTPHYGSTTLSTPAPRDSAEPSALRRTTGWSMVRLGASFRPLTQSSLTLSANTSTESDDPETQEAAELGPLYQDLEFSLEDWTTDRQAYALLGLLGFELHWLPLRFGVQVTVGAPVALGRRDLRAERGTVDVAAPVFTEVEALAGLGARFHGISPFLGWSASLTLAVTGGNAPDGPLRFAGLGRSHGPVGGLTFTRGAFWFDVRGGWSWGSGLRGARIEVALALQNSWFRTRRRRR